MPRIPLRVRLLPQSTLRRIRGDLDVRVPRRSARARASVRRWPWSSRRGRSVQVKLIKMVGLTETANEYLQESRASRNVQHRLVGLLRQSVYSQHHLDRLREMHTAAGAGRVL